MAEPFSFYKTNNGLKFFLVNCGSGLTHLIIFPDKTVMLFDCNLVNDSEKPERGKDKILALFSEVIPYKIDSNHKYVQAIDIFVNSHRDTDHLQGLKDVNEHFPIQSIWDSGQTGANVDNPDYHYYMQLRRCLMAKNKDNVLVPVPSKSVFQKYGNADVYVLSSSKDFVNESEAALMEAVDKQQHTNCIVLLLCYASRKILLTGDSDWKAWKESIVPNFKHASVNFMNTDILIASHHGSRSFFTGMGEINEEKYPEKTYTESIRLIKPKITLISCAEYAYGGYHLPNEEAMKLYKKHTSYGQVYTTNERGTFCGLIDANGNFSVTPWRFRNVYGQAGKRIVVFCKIDEIGNIISGESVKVGAFKLKFNVVGLSGIMNVADKPVVIWEVCNAGQNIHDDHHEIYYKDKSENDGNFYFSRKLTYKGTHLLRCTVINKRKKFVETVVFVIHGV